MHHKLIVIAEHTDDVIVVTPRAIARARGVVAHQMVIAHPMLTHPSTPKILDDVAPCLADADHATRTSFGRAILAVERARERRRL